MRLTPSFFLLAASVFSQAAEWQIDPAHSAAQFAVRHMMVSTVRGQFGKIAGAAHFDPAHPSAGSVQAEVEVASIDTRNTKRDAHLRSADFFDAARYPVMTFKSTGIETAGAGRLKLAGDLTIRGTTRPVVFEIQGLGAPLRDARGGRRVGATATATISRKAYGIIWNRVLEAGGVTVGDEVTITIDVELVSRPGPAS